jgi:mono/diheme cytochrome c family protein
MVCHTSQGGKQYSGGLGFKLPFGTLYSTNITADKETGIGNYSDQDFLNAVQRGTRHDGARLYPAMPYTSYTYMTDEDVLAVKAYLFSLPAVRAKAPDNTLSFPFNQRWAMIFWSAVFNPDTRFTPDTSKSPEWNRGAYLAEALAHCGECHTPRNIMGGLETSKAYSGTPNGPEGERVPNITPHPDSGIGKWSPGDLTDLIKQGMTPDGDFVGGSMAEVVRNTTSKLTDDDLRAVVAYLKALPPIDNKVPRKTR